MIDSGATTNFIDSRFVTLHSLPLTSKPLTETLLLADGKTQVIISKEVQLVRGRAPETQFYCRYRLTSVDTPFRGGSARSMSI